jgi:hypothetical protein
MSGIRWSSLLLVSIFLVSAGQAKRAPLTGTASGICELPPNGFVLGSLDPFDSGESSYTLQATLLDSGLAMCPACILGKIQGTLDDGIGRGPDFLVDGFFGGDIPSGAGTFGARVKRPNGADVGWIRGEFRDPFVSQQAGSFVGRFRIQR